MVRIRVRGLTKYNPRLLQSTCNFEKHVSYYNLKYSPQLINKINIWIRQKEDKNNKVPSVAVHDPDLDLIYQDKITIP